MVLRDELSGVGGNIGGLTAYCLLSRGIDRFEGISKCDIPLVEDCLMAF